MDYSRSESMDYLVNVCLSKKKKSREELAW